MKMKRIAYILAATLLAISLHAEELRIVSLDASGLLTWSNRLPNATYRVEWTSSLTESWQTNPPSTTVTTTNVVIPLTTAMHFRIVWLDPPSIRFSSLGWGLPYWGTSSVDLNEDGIPDISFQTTIYSIPEGGFSEQIIQVRGPKVVTTPYTHGTLIDSNLTWESTPATFARRTTFNGPFTGPWVVGTNAYMPIQFQISTNTHYGWLNVEEYQYLIEGGPTDLWVHSYRLVDAAYETIPDQSIDAGQTE